MKSIVICIGLLFGTSVLSLAAMPQVKDDLKTAGSATKDAAKDGAHKTVHGVKKAGRATKRTVKKGTHKAANATAKGANKVADKTNPNH